MSNLLEKASIITTPTAYDDGSILSVKPENGDGDFNFSRGSAATRVNAQGLVENVQILSSELVQNGNFSEIGSEEVSNGDFSQEGSELVTNGDFATDSDWIKGSGWTISGGKARASGVSGSNNLTQSGILIAGKIYKITITVSEYVSGTVEVSAGSSPRSEMNANGTYTFYQTATPSTSFYIISQVFNGSIDNVSVKEVGQDWTIGSGWSIGDDKLVSINGANYVTRPNATIVSGKTYKISYEVKDYVSGTFGIRAYTVGGITATANGTYTDYITSNGSTIELMGFGTFNGSVTNISVKEVGQDWSFTSIELIGANTFKNTGTNGKLEQSYTSIVGAKYRLSFTINSGNWNVVASTVNNTAGIIEQTGTTSNSGTIEFIATTTTTYILLYNIGASGTEASITNISLLQVTDDTDLPRINYEGFSYQDALGSELVTNGDFSDGSANWVQASSSITISGGGANFDGTLSTSNVRQLNIVESAKQYKVTYTVRDYVQGLSAIRLGAYTTFQSGNGTFTEVITSTSIELQIYGLSSFIGTIDNVSVKEYLGQEVVPNSGCGSWLFEPQSTNLITYSEDFSQSVWAKTGGTTVTSNTAISPDGTQNASTVSGLTGSGSNDLRFSLSTNPANKTYTFSVYLKGEGTLRLHLSNNVDSSASNVVTLTSSWVRYELIHTFGSTSSSLSAVLDDSGSTATEYDVWGAQLEELSYPTSYIPTDGATSTRLQDIANNSGNSTLINSTEGVLYAEIAALANDGTNRQISISDGTSSQRVYFGFKVTDNEIIMSSNNVASGSYNSVTHVLNNATLNNKFAFKYKENDFSLFVNGVKIGVVTSGVVPINLSVLDFDNGQGSSPFFGKTKALAVFKEALTDTELELLTAPAPEFPTFTLDFDTIAEQFTFTRGSEATFVNEQGLIQSTASNDAPRIDYSTGVEAFLLEPQSTNLVPYSEDFVGWNVNANITATDNAITSPEGVNNAVKLEGLTTSSLNQCVTINAPSLSGINVVGKTFTASVYIKPVNASDVGKDIVLSIQRNGGDFEGLNVTTEITSADWKRYDLTYTFIGTGAGNQNGCTFKILKSNTTIDDIYIYGVQLEEQSYATSYIPTDGATATRNQEVCKDATPTINSEEGVLYFEGSALADDGTNRFLSLNDGTTSNYIYFRYVSTSNQYLFRTQVGGVTVNTLSGFLSDTTQNHKFAFKFKSGDYAMWVDGVEISTDTSSTIFSSNTLSNLEYSFPTDGGDGFPSNTKGLQVFDKALSDYQLKQLTTI